MNRIKTYITCIPIIIWLIWSICLWKLWTWDYWKLEENFPYESTKTSDLKCDSSTDLWNCTSVNEKEDTLIVRLLEVFWLDNDTSKDKDLKFIDYAKAILNMALGLISFITLIMTIYTFYMMIFSENEAWIKKAKWNLIGIFIALCVIWLAWSIVSVIFWRYQSQWKIREKSIEWNAANATTTMNNVINNQNLSNYII